jgi:hypothetical protein
LKNIQKVYLKSSLFKFSLKHLKPLIFEFKILFQFEKQIRSPVRTLAQLNRQPNSFSFFFFDFYSRQPTRSLAQLAPDLFPWPTFHPAFAAHPSPASPQRSSPTSHSRNNNTAGCRHFTASPFALPHIVKPSIGRLKVHLGHSVGFGGLMTNN